MRRKGNAFFLYANDFAIFFPILFFLCVTLRKDVVGFFPSCLFEAVLLDVRNKKLIIVCMKRLDYFVPRNDGLPAFVIARSSREGGKAIRELYYM